MKTYPEDTFGQLGWIVSFWNVNQIIGTIGGLSFLTAIFFLATTENESLAPKKFANETLSLSEIWSEGYYE